MKLNYASSTFYRKCILFLFFLIASVSYSQNCTVNANVDRVLCPNDEILLGGTANSEFDFISNPFWTQISGPTVQIVTPNNLISSVVGVSGGNTYVFRLSATCQDGSTIYDDVSYTISELTTAIASEDLNYCAGTYPITGNAANTGSGETGVWSIEGANNAGVSIADVNSAATTITISGTNAGSTTIRWTIENGACESYDEIIVTTLGGETPVTAGDDVTLSNCYSATQSYQLNASFGGNSDQKGTWTVVSGPNNPSFDNINDNDTTVRGLVEGTYVLRWTVEGPCVQGQDEVTIVVPPATADLTNVSGDSQIYCDGRSTIVLQGTVPLYVNEAVQWTFTSGPITPTIVSPNTPRTDVTGLTVPGTYHFQYAISNNITNCIDTGDYEIEIQEAISISGGPDQILACDVTSVTIPVTSTGKGSTTWQVISGPDYTVSTSTDSQQVVNEHYYPYPSAPVSFNGSNLVVDDLDVFGTYVIRIIKSPEPGASCTTVYDDIVVEVSITPPGSNGGSQQVLACNVTEGSLAGNVVLKGIGTWSQVSGPNTAIIANVNNPETAVTGLISGEYQFRWTISGGAACDVTQSIASVIVSTDVPTAAAAGTDKTVCYGSSLQLEGNPTLANETGTWTVTPTAGVTIRDVNDPNAVVTGLQPDTVYTFTWTISNSCGQSASDDVVITTNTTEGPVSADAGPDQCLVDGTASVQLAANDPSPDTGTWSQISGPTATITNPNSNTSSVTGLVNGTYVFRWTIDNGGCAITEDDVTITVGPAVTTANAGPNQSICGTSVTLIGNTPAANETGSWLLVSGGDGPIITDPSSPSTTVTNLTAGQWTFSWTISNNACGESADTVQINVSEPPSAADAGADQELCDTNNTSLAATPPTAGTGTWGMISGPNSPSFSDLHAANTTISGLITGTYVLEWTVFNGINCPSTSDQISLVVKEGADAGDDIVTCLTGPLYLEGTIGTTGTWSYVSGPTIPTITATGGNGATVTNLATGDYIFRYTITAAGGCNGSSDDVNVTISGQASIANAGIDQELCNIGVIQLSATAPTLGTGKWTVLTGDTSGTFTPNDTDPNARYENAASGLYVFTWTVSDGACSNSDQVRINNAEPPTVANAGPDQNTVCGTTAQLAANNPFFGVGNWSQVTGPNTAVFSSIISPDAVVSGLTVGTYVFQWTISNGTVCNVSEDLVEVTVTNDITQPNAGPDQVACQSVAVTLAGNNLTVGLGTWSIVSGGTGTFSNVNSPTSTFTPNGSGAYVLQWASTQDSCILTDTMDLNVDGLPTTAEAGDPISECQFQPVTLNATAATVGTGTWTQLSGPSTVTFENPNAPNTNVFGTISGNYVFQWTISNGICATSSDSVNVEILALPTLAEAGPDQTICNLNQVTLAANQPTVGTGTWTIVTNAGNPPTITNPNQYNTTVTNLPEGTTRLRWTISNGVCTDYFDEVNIVRSPDLVVATLNPANICIGGTNNFTANVSGSITPYTYQWQISTDNTTFNAIPGATTNSYTTDSGLGVGTYYYNVVVNSTCAQVTSNAAQLTIVADPIVTTQPIGANLCAGQNHTMTVSASGDSVAGAINYQWQSSTDGGSYNNISGATSSSYTTPNLNQTTYYRVQITQSGSGCEVFSDPATVYVASITTQPTNPNPICTGGQLEGMNVVVSLNGGSGSLSYQWQSSTDQTNWVNETNSTSTTTSFTSDVLTPSTLPTTYYYRVVVTVDYGGGNTCEIISNTVEGIVAPDLNFTTQPQGGTVCNGGEFTLSVEANSYANYQWQSSSTGNESDFTDITGANSASYTTPGLSSDSFFRVILSNPSGGCQDVISDIAQVVVLPDPTVTNPEGVTICTGDTHTMSVTASGGISGSPYLYQWQIYNGSSYDNISGANSATYTTDPLSANAQYRVRIRQSEEGCEVFSDPAIVNVVTITAQPTAPAVVCVGGTVAISVTASANGGTTTFSYQWQSSPDGNSWVDVNSTLNPSALTADFTSLPLTQNTQFRCVITSSATNCSITSNAVTATVVADPSFTLDPQSQTICAGGSVTLTANASIGTGTFSYQWQVNTGAGFNDIVGATSSSYTTPSLTSTTLYRVIASATGAGCTNATSAVAQITVNGDPTISVQPADQSICITQTATLSVTAAEGVGDYQYQWQSAPSLGDTYANIVGATSATYTTPVLSDNAYYRVQVTNAATGCNVITSNAVTVFVTRVLKQPTDPNPVCAGGRVQMSVDATSGGGGTGTITYQWQSSPNETGTWTNVTSGQGATSKLYISDGLIETTFFRCLMNSTNPTCGTPSNVVKAVVVPDTSVVLDNPNGGVICEGGTFDLSVTAINTAAALNYQWEQSATGNEGTWAGVVGGVGANSPNYTTAVLYADTHFRVRVSSSGFNTGCDEVYSPDVLVEVVPKPVFTTQPEDAETCLNTGHTFTAAATSSVLGSVSYQWQTASALSGPYANVTEGTGGTTATYTTPAYDTTGNRYFRVLVSQSTAGCDTESNTVTLTVNDTPVVSNWVITQPSCSILTGTIAITEPDLGTGYEYKLDNGSYQVSNIFTNLDPGSSHEVYVRRQNATNCESVAVPFEINNRICAVPENFAALSGDVESTTPNAILDSDTLNDVIVTSSNVQLTVDSQSSYLILNSDNTITVAAGTPPGDYTLTYTICENGNLTNCSTTTETISVTTAGIDARIDIVPYVVNGFIDNPSVINALTNDRLATTIQATTSNVVISVNNPAQPKPESTNGIVPVLDIATGNVSVPAGTVKGLYTINYKICETGSTTNCDSADILVQVGTTVIDADDDRIENINGFNGATLAGNAIVSNDSINGRLITANDLLLRTIIVTQENGATPLYNGAKVPIFSPSTGNVSVPAGTPADTYYITYHICEALNPTNCSDASIAIVVDAPPIEANDDAVNNIDGFVGQTNVINAYTNTSGADYFNGAIINVNLTGLVTPSVITPATEIVVGKPVPVLNVNNGFVTVPSGTPAGTYTIKYQLCDNLNPGDDKHPSNCDDAIITINVMAPIIDAVDDLVTNVNGYTGANGVINAATNDSLGGTNITLSTITASVITGAAPINGVNRIPTLDITTGLVNVPAGTPAGIYKIVYEICDALNPNNCDQATIEVRVLAPSIDAIDDSVTGINGFAGQTDVLNALDNDLLNGVTVLPSEVTLEVTSLASPINNGQVPLLNPITGQVDVPAGTTAGTYTIGYRIYENLNPLNRDTAVITITVVSPAIDAVNDAVSGINGLLGSSNAINALDNDTLNGVVLDKSLVTITDVVPATPISGTLVPVLDAATGIVSVPAGTPAGTYEIEYRIFEKLNPSNTDTAIITVEVNSATINAENDAVTGVNGYIGLANALNALTNDTLNGVQVVPSQITIAVTTPATGINGGAIPVLNTTTGIVTVPAGTAAGTYTIVYSISENLNPTNVDEATISVDVIAPTILAVDDTTPTINGYTGQANVMSALTNDRLNGLDIVISQITLTSINTTTPTDYISGNPIPVIDETTGIVTVPVGTSAGVYMIHYSICENLNPTNCDEADIVVNVSAPSIIANDDFSRNPINGFEGANNVVNALQNDRLNNAAARLVDVTISTLSTIVPSSSTNGIVPILHNLTGLVDVPLGTSAGTYIIQYQICDKLNPTNCDDAEILITVDKPTLVANDDLITNINGFEGASNIVNAFTSNDTYNGNVLTDVNLIIPAVVTPATAINGGPVPTLDTATGLVSVPVGTPAGAYQITYQICDALNPSSCDRAVISITVITPTIVANDDEALDIVGYVGATNVVNAFDNDLLNGVAVNRADIVPTLVSGASSINGAPVPVLSLLTGNVDVPAGTAVGEYKIVYQICDRLNPTHCDQAVITITVIPATIDAIDDSVTGINGFAGQTDVLNALDNDLLNGVTVVPSEVTLEVTSLASPINNGQVPLLNPTTGQVDVPPGTTAGIYTIGYRIYENLNPLNRDTAVITITVVSPAIEAVDDAVSGINGLLGSSNAINALDNDTLNGVVLDKSLVTITDVVPATPISGTLVPVLDAATGIVSVPAGTPAGSYEIEYRIFEKLNPSNTDTAIITVEVNSATINAEDDAVTGINGYTGSSNALNALTNDMLNGVQVLPSQITIAVTTPATGINGGAIPVLNISNGIVSVPAGTAAGTYTIEYRITENLNPGNTDLATITIEVEAPVIVANDDTASSINGYDGAANVVNALTNDTLNGSAAKLAEVTIAITTPATPINGGLVPVLDEATGLVAVPAGTPAGSYTITYSLSEKLNPTNTDTATITIEVISANIVANPDLALGINGYVGADNVVNALDNDLLNGALVNNGEIVITVVTPATAIGSGAVPTLDTVTGIVSVPAGTSAGTYTIAYQICEALNPANCDTSTITVTVVAPVLLATDDSITGIDGSVDNDGVLNVLDNDQYNGQGASLSEVSITVLNQATPINGGNVPILDTTTGLVSIPAGTPEGSYTITYEICDNLNAGVCDDAVVVIEVVLQPIVANDDNALNINGYEGVSSVLNAFDNDELNGSSVSRADIVPTQITGASPINGGPVPTLNLLTGNVAVPAGTPAGTYTITYQICERLNPAHCDQATITIEVISGGIDAVDDVVTPAVNGFVGEAAVLNVLTNDTLNGATVIPAEVKIEVITLATAINNGKVPTLDPLTGMVSVPAGTTQGVYTITYRLSENLNLTNTDTAIVTINVTTPAIDAVNDAVSGINGLLGSSNAINALDNDTLNGFVLDKSLVTITDVVPASPISGTLVPVLDAATGIVSVPAGTPAGSYEIEYRIFEKLNPSNTDTAIITVEVNSATINAEDDAVTGINGYIGSSNALNALNNDTLNGVQVVPSQITIAVTTLATGINGGAIPVLNISNGIVSVPAGTSAGTYTIIYSITENLNPSNTDSATITIEVEAPVIVANDDTASGINGYDGASNVVNALTNDTLNGSVAKLAEVTIAITTPATPINGGLVPVLDEATGLVAVPAGTPAGSYTITYSLSEKLNPTNTDTATITIEVISTSIVANPDLALGVDGFVGNPNVLQVLDNDTLNGSPVQLSQVTISLTARPATVNAFEPVLDTATGIVSVPAGTPAGTYRINYQICEVLNPTNCDTSVAVITVGSGVLVANDDSATNINGNDGATAVVDVLANDTLDGTPTTLSEVVIRVTSSADPIGGGAVPTLDVTSGLVHVPAGTSSGIYTISYQICEGLNPTNCDEAVVKITVTQPDITLIKRGTFVDTNGDGFAQAGELIQYNFVVQNTGAIDLTNVMISDPKVTVSGAALASLVVGASNSTQFTATYVLTQADINAGYVENQATVTANPIFGTPISDLSDSNDPTLLGKDDPTVTPIPQQKELTLIKGGVLMGDGSVGDIINYSFVVTNTGNVVLQNVAIDDPMLGRNLVVTPSALAPGESGTASASYAITVGDVANGEVINSALAVGDAPDGTTVFDVSDSTDPTLPGDDDPTVIDLSLKPSIAVIKYGSFDDNNGNGYAEVGETISYTFTVANTGNIALVNIVVTDPKPGITISGGPIALRAGQTDATTFKATYTLTQADIEAGSVTNQAIVNALSPDGVTVSDLSDDDEFAGNDPTVVPLNSCQVTIHNAISPNGDGKNDFFFIEGIECYPNATVEIYDRWGVLVYDSVGYDNGAVSFKGYSDGRATVKRDAKLPDGTYFYVISYKTYQNQIINETGYLYISGNN
ncbi:gliding motility-associated C-terminal domain-containing protein [Flavobacterium agrisoli]|uniref:Gliding motility-associated C-terminal domain-containing protein n=1 Tax=Flavobacterium agrisoli TaxID=2793066 RepID=A0A934UKG4_9FLAO|nr:gliding motility-associated C-terminal domain-containing protein [Flavobacterium agrisoli]MBK0370514.1 gliding motility-associated C-terminal domain-containing protein [Flavobacterium agrisoli]